LDASRMAAGQLQLRAERLDLAEVARDCAELYADDFRAAGSALTLGLEPVEGLWDRGRVEQVVGNLLSNAAKYGGGKPVALSLRREAGCAVLAISDRGIGIPATELPRLFHPFERTSVAQSINGHGLGLYIARGMVASMGGTICVESAPQSGTTFIVRLPCGLGVGTGQVGGRA
jgi:two-component system, LuxR family, sensor kinase FixL